MIIDTHIHLDHPCYDTDRDDIIKNAKENNVVKIITAGIDRESSEKCLELAKKYDIVEAAIGIYPEDALMKEKEMEGIIQNKTTTLQQDIDFIKKNSKNIIAIGECGLDLYNGKDLVKQKNTFKEMINLSIELNKPIIIHSRKAEKETIDFLQEFKKLNPDKVVMHCFSGKKILIDKCIEKGYNFSIPTNIVRAENFKELAKKVPIKKILTETDGPYLSPYKNSDSSFNRNEPKYIKETIKELSRIKGITEKECENLIFMNFQRIFL